MTEQSQRREGSPGEDLGTRHGRLINFKEHLGWESGPVALLTQGDLKPTWRSTGSQWHVCLSRGQAEFCATVLREEMELQEIPPWKEFTGADRLHGGMLAPSVLAAGTLPGVTGSLPSVRRTSLAPLVLFGFCLVLEGKVGGCDDSQESGTRWLNFCKIHRGSACQKNPIKPELVGSSIVL